MFDIRGHSTENIRSSPLNMPSQKVRDERQRARVWEVEKEEMGNEERNKS